MKIKKKVKLEKQKEKQLQDDDIEKEEYDYNHSFNNDESQISQDNDQVSNELQLDKEVLISEKYVEILIKKILNNRALNAIKAFLKIFRFIVNEDSSNKEGVSENEKLKVKQFFQIENSKVYTMVMTFAFQSFPKILKEILEKQKNNRKTEIIFKVFVINFFKFMDQSTDDKIVLMCLKSLQMFVDLICPYLQYLKRYTYFLIEQFCTSEQIQIKLHAFLVLKKIFQSSSQEFLQQNLKKLYLNLLKNSKQVNHLNYQWIQFMINCFVELLQINSNIGFFIQLGYTLIIQFMQQFIVHLKMGYREKSKENIHMIYNWQIFNCFQLWARISKVQEFQQLKFPIVQLILAMLNLFWTEKHFPLFLKFFELIRDLVKDDIYVPIMRLLIKMLQSQNFKGKKGQSESRKFDFLLNIKISKKHLDSSLFWTDIFNEVCDQLVSYLADQSNNVYFPEMSIYVLRELKLLKKELKFAIYKEKLSSIIKLIEDRNKIISENRLNRTPLQNSKIKLKNDLKKKQDQILKQKELQLQSSFKKDNEMDFSENDDEPEKKQKKKSQKQKPVEILPHKDDISSEPSEFVDEREEEGSVFGQDEILSDYESLEGDPENISDFSKE